MTATLIPIEKPTMAPKHNDAILNVTDPPYGSLTPGANTTLATKFTLIATYII